MAAGLSRPDVWLGYCANRDPNDINTPSVWTALESTNFQVLSVTGQAHGRDYELAQPMAADPVLLVRDVNEYLNPDNPSSPLAGLVRPYREICALAQWPITAIGASVNLLNSGTWRGSNVDTYDPAFESYTTSASAPNWLDRYGVSSTITTTNPQQGTKCATYTVSAAGQGLAWGVPCIPGRQYTSSVYVRQSAANTLGLFLEGVTGAWDRCNRTVVAGLGTPDASWLSAAYTLVGSAADFAVTSAQMVLTLSAANSVRSGQIGSFYDSEQTISITAPVLATGDSYVVGLASRYVDANNHYRALLRFNSDQSVSVFIEQRLAGASSTLVSTALPFSYAAGDRFHLNFRTRGITLYASVWPRGAREGGLFTASTTSTSAALQVSGNVGPIAYRFPANTNANLPATFEQYSAIASVAGTTTSASGSYQRLSVTFTADGVARPAHVDDNPLGKLPQGLAVSVQTIGATSAATVNIDAIQHEQAATASAFISTGPVIYPLFRNFAERYPRTWRARGYEGIVAIPCVDALALLNKIFISNPADQAVRNTQPDYFWTLAGGADSTSFPDSSGHNGPALNLAAGKDGPGILPVAGTAIPITGDAGATGVLFDRNPTATPPGETVLGIGPSAGVQALPSAPVALPPVPGIPWAMSAAAWVQLENTGAGDQIVLTVQRVVGSSPNWRPIQLRVEPAQTRVLLITGITSTGAVFPTAIMDGELHHLVGTVEQTATTTTLNLYVDGSLGATTSVANATAGGILGLPADSVYVGGTFVLGDGTGVAQGTVAKVALWNRVLSAAEAGELYSAGLGINETSGARILHHLQDGPYNGPTRIAEASTETIMGVSTVDGSTDLLTDSLNTMQAEQGMFWVQPDGVIAFESRQNRWLRLTSTNTFGENGASAEIAYQDGIVFDHDPTYVFPVVTWTRNGGATALGGLPADRQEAMDSYFPRQFDGSSDLAEDSAAQDLADWIFYTHRAPNTRVAEIEIDPWTAQGTPYSMWAQVLGLEVGQRVTAVRRASSANAGAGLTMSVPCFIERVGTPEMTFTMGEERWTVTLQLSPIGAAPDGPTVQPWILEDTTYGVLDSTTVLGW